MTIRRRFLLRDSALVAAGAGFLLPGWLARAVAAAAAPPNSGRRKVLVVLFQRGAMDGLNAVIPFTDPHYYAARPTIAVPAPGKPGGALDLDGRFALHPSLAPLQPLWQRKQLAIIPGTGSPDPTRSHFDAQDYMESGTPGRKSTRDGWLNRSLSQTTPSSPVSPLRAISLGPRLARTLRGAQPAVAIGRLRDFQLHDHQSQASLESMYAAADQEVAATARDTFAALKLVEAIERRPYTPAAGAAYPTSKFGQALLQIARLIKSDAGVEVAFADTGGWDTHTNQAQRLPALLADFAGSMSAFTSDLGDRFEDVIIVTLSEFGHTLRENGAGGTDHGHASVMFVAGGSSALQGGRIHGAWPGLAPEQLFEQRDLAVTTDFRCVLSELVAGHLGVADTRRVFPGAPADALSARVGLLG